MLIQIVLINFIGSTRCESQCAFCRPSGRALGLHKLPDIEPTYFRARVYMHFARDNIERVLCLSRTHPVALAILVTISIRQQRLRSKTRTTSTFANLSFYSFHTPHSFKVRCHFRDTTVYTFPLSIFSILAV